MPKAMKICKVCGREYEACHTPNPGVWRWRDVACCYEHGLQYLHDVQVARGEIVEEKAETSIVEPEPVFSVEDSVLPSTCAVANDTDEDATEEATETVVATTRRARSRKK